MIKAVAGGGGRGMRAAHNEASLVQGFHSARTEAEKAFGNAEVYIEKLIENPHHIEFQIMADSHGHIVHLGERDCSIQRRNQKVIEECPSPLLTPALRKKMGNAAVKLAKSVGYDNAGTMEFLVDQRGQFLLHRDEHAHPGRAHDHRGSLRLRPGEGTDSDRGGREAFAARRAARLRALARHPMPDQRRGSGAAIFSPPPGGSISTTRPGGRGVRIDSHAYTGYTVPPYYDSMIAKLITVGATRESAIARMRRALGEYLHHRNQDDDSVSQRDHAQRRFPQRQLRHRLCRSGHELGQLRAEADARAGCANERGSAGRSGRAISSAAGSTAFSIWATSTLSGCAKRRGTN